MKRLKRTIAVLLASLSVSLGYSSQAAAQQQAPAVGVSYHCSEMWCPAPVNKTKWSVKTTDFSPPAANGAILGVFDDRFLGILDGHLLGAFNERTVIRTHDKNISCSLGLSVNGQLRKEASIPFPGDAYSFCKTHSVYIKVRVIPSSPRNIITWSGNIKFR